MEDIRVGGRAHCPHCQTVVLFSGVDMVPVAPTPNITLNPGGRDSIRLTFAACPACGKPIVGLEELHFQPESEPREVWGDKILLWPRYGSREPAPPEVPPEIAKDYQEAALTLPVSAKSSAALSRRCLQAVLRGAGFSQHDLAKQIEAALPTLPSHLSENLDAIRNVGNFAAHPTKDQNSGAILDVEPGEAEWNLDVLEDLFDFYYVQPALAKKKRDALNAKLQAANKPPMK